MEVWFHPDAVAEAAGSREWYAARSARAAAAFAAELDRSIATLREAPLRWPPYGSGTRRLIMRRFPFALVYRVAPQQIQVIAVAHLRRRPGFWRQRLLE